MHRLFVSLTVLALGSAGIASNAHGLYSYVFTAPAPAVSAQFTDHEPWLRARLQHWRTDLFNSVTGGIIDVTSYEDAKLYNSALTIGCRDAMGTLKMSAAKVHSVQGDTAGDIRLVCPAFHVIMRSMGTLDAL